MGVAFAKTLFCEISFIEISMAGLLFLLFKCEKFCHFLNPYAQSQCL
jgi:hypothetical protein